MNINFEVVRYLFDQSSDLVQGVAPDGTLLYTNLTWNRVLGYSTEVTPAEDTVRDVPTCFLDVVHPDDRDRYQQVCAQLRSPGESCTLSLTLLTQNGAMIPVTGRVCCQTDGGELPQLWCLWHKTPEPAEQALRRTEEHPSLATRAARVGGWEQVQTEAFDQRAEILLTLQNRILASIAAGAPLPSIWQELMAAIEAQLKGAISSILLLDAGNKVRQSVAPRLPESYHRAIDGLVIGDGVGSCGTAAFRRELVIVTDIATDLRWQNFQALAREHDLRACWSMPIIARDSQVLGTFAVYFSTPRSPHSNELEILSHAANIARIALERHQAETVLQQKAEQARLIAYLTQQIRQSLDLDVILQTTATEVRQLLETDRVAVYRFDGDEECAGAGQVIVESVREPWTAILRSSLCDPCFTRELVEQYRQGRIFQEADIQNAGLTLCYVEFLQQFQVRANLVLPILQEGQLWGLLCVHHCRAPRSWQPSEVELLTQLANQLAIAIQQATTHQQLQEELKVRQLAEAALQESEAQNRAILSAIPDILASISADGTYLHFSRNGFTGEVFPVEVGASVSHVLPPAVAAQKYRAIEAALRTGELQLYEQQLEWGDRIQYEEVRVVPYRDNAVLCVVRNISDRKQLEKERQQVEAALRRSEAQYRAIVEDQTELICRCLPDRTVIFVNPAYCRYFGQSPRDFLGHSFLPLILAEDQPLVQAAIAQITLNRPIVTYEHRVLLPDGTIRWQQWTERAIFDGEGQVIEYQAVGRDITERKQAEHQIQQLNQELEAKVEQRTAELRDSEERFRNLYEQSPLGISITDLNGRLLQVNDQLCQITGYSAEELIHHSFDRLIHPADRLDSIQLFQQVVTGEQPRSMVEKRYICKTGEIVWVQTTKALLCDRQGQRVGVISMMQDVTQRKATEEALQNQEKLLNLFFAQSLDGFFFMILDQPIVWNAETDKDAALEYVFAHQRVTRINEAMLAQYAATLEQFLGLTPADFFAHDLDHGKAVWREFFDRGRLHIETDERKFDGTPVSIEGDYICLYDAEGRITGHFGVQRDVSDRKCLEQERQIAELALRESETRFRTLVQNVNVGIVVHDAQMNVLLNNPKALELLGVTEDQLLGKAAFDPQWRMIHENGLPMSYDEHPIVQTIVTREPVRNRVVGVQRPNTGLRSDRYPGDVVWLLINADPQQTAEGVVQQVIASFADITYLKQLESKAFKALQKERELKEMKSRFASMISHEFRTPLTVIQSATDILRMLTEKLDDCEEYYRQIDTATQHMTRMLNDILWIGKFDSGQMETRYDPMDLVGFCQEMIREFQLAYGKIYPFYFTYKGQPQTVWLDPKLLRPMLNNLLSNAVKYSPQQSPVELRLIYGSTQVTFEVQDYGIGIPETAHKQLFDAFYRAENVDTIQGTGLGLAIVKQCVDSHGGQISLQSQVGLGTTFTIRLPYQDYPIGHPLS